jgi:hypothetical protein
MSGNRSLCYGAGFGLRDLCLCRHNLLRLRLMHGQCCRCLGCGLFRCLLSRRLLALLLFTTLALATTATATAFAGAFALAVLSGLLLGCHFFRRYLSDFRRSGYRGSLITGRTLGARPALGARRPFATSFLLGFGCILLARRLFLAWRRFVAFAVTSFLVAATFTATFTAAFATAFTTSFALAAATIPAFTITARALLARFLFFLLGGLFHLGGGL